MTGVSQDVTTMRPIWTGVLLCSCAYSPKADSISETLTHLYTVRLVLNEVKAEM